jgi:hypothetical protein
VVAGYPGPNLTRATEHMLGVLAAAGFPVREAEQALTAVTSYVTGMAMSEAAWANWLERHGQDRLEWADDALRAAEQATEGHPHLREVMTTYEGIDPQKSLDDDFDYGLDRVLDGLQGRLDAL